jgi:hypothetical protein
MNNPENVDGRYSYNRVLCVWSDLTEGLDNHKPSIKTDKPNNPGHQEDPVQTTDSPQTQLPEGIITP